MGCALWFASLQVLRAMTPFETALPVDALRVGYDGKAAQKLARDIAVETAINIVYAPVPYAVMMASPQDLQDFAIGFSLTEGIIDHAGDIRSVSIEAEERGLRLVVTLASDLLQRHLGRSRAMAGRTGCGLCGIDDLKNLPQAKAIARHAAPLALASVHRALLGLEARQPLNAATRAVHAAAYADAYGEILLLREDVGRHNALDKMIGAALRAGIDPADGFVLVTSRCSFEMVEKAAIFGAAIIVAISAPTSLAIERAQAHGMGLMAVARPDSGMIFCNEQMFAG